jgi:DNA-binding LacI/PurR family transcriptional regulator
MQEVGQLATRLLIQSIEAPEIEGKEVLLKAELVRRGSSGSRRGIDTSRAMP